MLATTLMRQQLRCMQNMVIKKPLLTANGSLVAKQQLLATSAVNRSSGDHVRMWTMERGVSVLQIPALIVPFIHTTFMTDAIFCTLAVLHSHWGKKYSRRSVTLLFSVQQKNLVKTKRLIF